MDFKESKPIYLQIADRICNEILTGKYPDNERIPSVREYAASLEVNANTVVRSYDYLQNNEVIFNKRGIGYFVSEGAADKILIIRRNLFMSSHLEDFFKEIDMLHISINEIVELYKNRK
ncbi:MAG: GntR family transcriptional regulator [Bacteroidales bacterium]|nr:GntR family transcriptional regulator [Bacteroidales bacterium]